MFPKLVGLGLLLIPFFIWPGFDSRQPKLLLAMVFSLVLGLLAFYKGYFKACKNIWLLLFLGFIPLNYLLAPQISLRLSGVPAASWIMQAFLYVLIFFLGYQAISSYEFSDDTKTKILKTMVLAGSIMSSYAIIQYFGFDQFFQGQQGGYIAACGTLGSPNILGPFLAMIIPIALYLKKYIVALVMITLVFITNSQIAYGAMVVSLIFLVGIKYKKLRIAMISLFVVLFLVLSIGYVQSRGIKNFIGGGSGSGRFPVWAQIVRDVKNPMPNTTKRYSLTGFGLGSFKYLFHVQHPVSEVGDNFLEAHNDYLELLYNTGLIGLGLFLMAIFHLISQAFPLTRLNAHLLASFICIAICAGGVFIWQNGAIIFYTIVVAGLLNKREVQIGK